MPTCKFEDVKTNEGRDLEMKRAKVPGGWFVVVYNDLYQHACHIPSVTFYPDPNHHWDGNSLPLDTSA